MAVFESGIGHREPLSPEYAVLPVVIDRPAEQRAQGTVLQRAPAQIRVETSPNGREFKELFESTGAKVELLRECFLR